MSEVSELGGPLTAGNTVANLQGTDVLDAALPSAADLDAVAAEQAAKEATASSTPEVIPAVVEDENVFDVSRAEFEEFREAYLRLVARVERFNQSSPHKI